MGTEFCPAGNRALSQWEHRFVLSGGFIREVCPDGSRLLFCREVLSQREHHHAVCPFRKRLFVFSGNVGLSSSETHVYPFLKPKFVLFGNGKT